MIWIAHVTTVVINVADLSEVDIVLKMRFVSPAAVLAKFVQKEMLSLFLIIFETRNGAKKHEFLHF